ncbi:hypothetical protein RSSM_01283 [Rhodopirellula sallentina SM41]|uniref:Uncharacterized protein n=1 Tax=Rhodopirellula sallentina SM41 TaxID=1263870 RepID=M5UHI0_9BACT|nr:hypothetical protein RSSM_01283 [Rhodopirellula sallentina SM41]
MFPRTTFLRAKGEVLNILAVTLLVSESCITAVHRKGKMLAPTERRRAFIKQKFGGASSGTPTT